MKSQYRPSISDENIVFKLRCAAAAAKSLQSCPTLCDPIDGSPPGSSIHGIFQARVLEWGAIAFSKITSLGVLVLYPICFREEQS